jgi:hypothetical protein
MEFAAELEASLREFTSAGCAELCENGGRVSAMSKLSWEVRGSADKPLLHLWSDDHNLTRRVLAITDHSEERLVLAVERFGRSRPGRLEFVRTDFERGEREVSRGEFCEHLREVLSKEFPDESLESITTAADLEHSLSGNYPRGVMKRGTARIAFIAAGAGETQDSIDNILTFALLWLERVHNAANRGVVTGLRVILPRNSCGVVAHRMAAVEPNVSMELFELDGTLEVLEKIDPRRAGNLRTWLVPFRESESLIERSRGAVDEVVALDREAITVHPCAATREVVLRYRGLSFAHWKDGTIFFGLNEPRRELSSLTRPGLESLLQKLHIFRHPLATDTRHALYRAQPERWLEAIVRQDVTRIDAMLDARFAYSQVFAGAGAEHGIIDVLTITRDGRLAVLELKAGEHIHLPLQAADYWLRIRRHLELDELRRYGYFQGVEIQAAPPLIYLVAPALRFHPSTGMVTRHLVREIEVVRVGIAESWRRGIRVVMRQ